jgi:hypothetical protein
MWAKFSEGQFLIDKTILQSLSGVNPGGNQCQTLNSAAAVAIAFAEPDSRVIDLLTQWPAAHCASVHPYLLFTKREIKEGDYGGGIQKDKGQREVGYTRRKAQRHSHE